MAEKRIPQRREKSFIGKQARLLTEKFSHEFKSTEERLRSLEEHVDNLTGRVVEIEAELKKRR